MKIANCRLQIANCKLDGRVHVLNPGELSERLLSFAARVGKTVDALPDTRLGRHVAGQLVRCGTLPAPNYEEGRAAESRADFVHKLSICLKELRESRFWIRLIIESELLSKAQMRNLLDESTQLCRIIGQSIVTAKEKRTKKKSLLRNQHPRFAICNLQCSIRNSDDFDEWRGLHLLELLDNWERARQRQPLTYIAPLE